MACREDAVILHACTRWAGAHLHEVIAGVEAQGLEGVQAGGQLGTFEALQRQPHGVRQRLQQALGWLMLQPTAGLQDQGQALQTMNRAHSHLSHARYDAEQLGTHLGAVHMASGRHALWEAKACSA